MTEPSVSVPFVDFFGLPHGRPVAYHSALHAVQEGRGLQQLRAHAVRRARAHRGRPTAASARSILYYQVDYTLQPSRPTTAWDTCTWRSGARTPRCRRRDFVIVDGLEGPGRFLGCNVGVRVIDAGDWYGEGEVKVYRDGDDELPDDLRHRARGLRRQRVGHGRAQPRPTEARRSTSVRARPDQPEFVSFYRWHVLDPIMFTRPEGHDPADRRDVLPAGPGGGSSRSTSGRIPVGGRGLAVRRDGSGHARVGHRRTRRRLLRDRVRVLHATRSRCRGSTSPPRSPTSNAVPGRRPIPPR